MKKLFLFMVSFIALSGVAISQEEATLTVEVSNDSILLGNYVEVKFTIKNASVSNFEAPSFDGFVIVSGPNQSSSMMINNGSMTQTIAYSYYLEPVDVGNYFITPAFVDTDKGVLESIPLEVLVVDNPEGIIQRPKRNNRTDFFNRDDFFGGDSFWGGGGIFDDFFNQNKNPLLNDRKYIDPEGNIKTKKNKKKRKTYKL